MFDCCPPAKEFSIPRCSLLARTIEIVIARFGRHEVVGYVRCEYWAGEDEKHVGEALRVHGENISILRCSVCFMLCSKAGRYLTLLYSNGVMTSLLSGD